MGLLLLLGSVVFGAGVGLRDPWPADEPRYTLVAMQMVDSGQWLIPMRGGEPYPDKPPVLMWAIASFYLLTGSMRVAFLLPSLLAALGTVALVFDLARRLWDRAVGWQAGLLLLLTVQFTLQAREAQIDMLLTFFVTVGVYAFMRFLLGGSWSWYGLAWAAAGLGVITKGVGFLALFILLPALWTHRDRLRQSTWREWLKALAGPLCFLGAIALWAVPMLLAVHASQDLALAAYRDNLLFRQTLTRYAAAWHHVKPWHYYLTTVIPAFWLPISIVLPWLVRAWARKWREGDARTILLLGYVILVLLFFSASPGKRGVYITPAVPALVLAAAPHLEELLRGRWPRRLWQVLAWSLAILLAALAIAAGFWPSLLTGLLEVEVALPFLPLLLAAAIGCGSAWTLRGAPVAALLAQSVVVWFTTGWVVNPSLNLARTPTALLREVEASVPAGDELLLVAWKEQFPLLSQRRLSVLPIKMRKEDQATAAAAWQAVSPRRWVMGPDRFLAGRFDTTGATDLGTRHGEHWTLLPPGRALPVDNVPEAKVFDLSPLSCSGAGGWEQGASGAGIQDSTHRRRWRRPAGSALIR